MGFFKSLLVHQSTESFFLPELKLQTHILITVPHHKSQIPPKLLAGLQIQCGLKVRVL